ncbi:unnamed protein product [Didymodactylos carnosus]|uniref:ADP-ribosylation factor-like protein 2-binding protein n=1 Tax=Didymodactylos carnosus TaxID=1234261 RepID=A0A814WK39_9BILA|nr:unnamed protein product [Didymodactylos carnosus]CAF3969401.1 unnamed protein product [Didymodactylos carnosus]
MATNNSVTTASATIDDEIFASHASQDPETELFDRTIGVIEDMIMDDEFRRIQDQFLEQNCREFDDSDENKLSYTTIHKDYLNIVENYVINQLKKKIPQFDLEPFMKQLTLRKQELEGEIFEFLCTFTDFLAFKEMMLDYKKSSENAGQIDTSSCLQSISLSGIDYDNDNRAAMMNRLTPMLDQVKVDDDEQQSSLPTASSAQSTRIAQLDLGIQGTKLKAPSSNSTSKKKS